MRLSLPGKKIVVNQILLSKLWYICQIYTITKYIKKEIEKRICKFLWNRKANTTSQPPSSTFHLEGWTRYFRYRHPVKLHFTNKNFLSATSIEKVIDQSIFLNLYTKQDFSSDNSHFYYIPPRDISDKFVDFYNQTGN